MLLFASKLRSYRDLPLRYAESGAAAPQRACGRSARADPRALRHPGRRPHLLTRGSDRAASSTAVSTICDVYGMFGLAPRAELSTRPENKLGSDEEWDFTEGELRAALDRHGIPYDLGAGEGSFYGPKIDLHITDALGRTWQMGTIQLDCSDAGALRSHLRRRRQPRAHPSMSSTAPCSAPSSASSASCSSTPAATCRCGWRRCRCA